MRSPVQTILLLMITLLVITPGRPVHGWFWDKYVVNVCSEQPVQQMFCAFGRLYALSNGQIHYGPYCGALGVNETLMFDHVLDTNGLVQSAFYDRSGHLYLLKDNLILIRYDSYRDEVYNASQVISHFEQPISYFSYSDQLDTVYVVTKYQKLYTFNQYLYTSREHIRWGNNRNRTNLPSKIVGMRLQYFFFVNNHVVIKLKDMPEHLALPHVMSCTKRTIGNSGFAECLQKELELDNCKRMNIKIQICKNFKYLILLLLLLLLLILIMLLLCCLMVARYRRNQGQTWNVAKKEEQLIKKILSKLPKEERQKWLKEGGILEKVAKHKFEVDENNNDLSEVDNERNEKKERILEQDYLLDPNQSSPNQFPVDNESLLSSIHVEDFQENRPDIDLSEPSRPNLKFNMIPVRY